MKKLARMLTLLMAAILLFTACSPRPGPVPGEETAALAARQPVPQPEETLPAATQPEAISNADPEPEIPADTEPDPLPEAQEGEASDVADPQEAAEATVYYAQALPGTIAAAATGSGSISDINLSIPATFRVTRPTEQITTTYATYFITGTSDPGQSLTIDGNAIPRNGTMGTWGVQVNLATGTNTFTIRQGDQSQTVTIVRTGSTVSTISEIRQGSMYPSTQGGVKTGEYMLVECVAPAGGTVVASFEGRSVTLQQVASASTGVPATYRGQLLVEGDYQTGVTSRVGKVTYQLTYNGATTTYQSSGDMYVAGVGSRIAIRVTDDIGTLYNSTSQLGVFRVLLKPGATDYVAGEDDDYFQLASGGYLPKSQAEIITGQVSVQNSLSSVGFASTTRKEEFHFRGTVNPVYNLSIRDNVLYLTMYNTSGTPSVDTGGSRLFSQAGATDNGGSVTYSFPFKNGGLFWGYNVSFQDNDLVLRVNYRPTVNAGSSTPLSGVVIVLDPGHGGDDSGAPGVAAGVGPSEADLNLAHAYATRDALTALGATVYLTHTGQTMELHERLAFFEAREADLFISLHHNSLAESTNANTVTGTEVYYHTATSQNLAGTMLSAVSSGLGRTARHYRQSYYRVTILPQAPSILLELGYVSNPVEYERATTLAEINRAAQAIANGVVKALQ